MDEEKFNQIKNVYDKLDAKIAQCEKHGKPINFYVKKQIEIIEALYKNFVKTCDKQGIDRNIIKRCSAEIWYNTRLKILSEKIGLSAEKYIDEIKTISDSLGIDYDIEEE